MVEVEAGELLVTVQGWMVVGPILVLPLPLFCAVVNT